jgi:hypothetical protein
VTTSADGKKVYSADFLLSFQSRCTDKPANLPPMTSWVRRAGGAGGAGGGGGGRGGRNNSARGGGRGGRGGQAGGRGGSPSGADRRGGRRNDRGGRVARTPGGYQSTSTGPVEPLAQSDTRWQRPADVAEDEAVLQRVTGLLNKLTFERFDAITEKIVNAGVSTPELLHSVIGLIFDKALMEPKFSRMYAYLCANLDDSMPQFDVPGDERKETFRRGLLQKCQREFATPPDWSKLDGLEGDERQELEFKMKLRVMGNVQFIGELHNRQLLPESVMHQCGRELIGNDLNEPDEDNIEKLCRLFTTIGKTLDVKVMPEEKRAHRKQVLDQYYLAMMQLSKAPKISPRIRFMLLDLLELRANNWTPRFTTNDPKKLAALHREMEEQAKFDAIEANMLARRGSGSNGGGGGGGGGRGGGAAAQLRRRRVAAVVAQRRRRRDAAVVAVRRAAARWATRGRTASTPVCCSAGGDGERRRGGLVGRSLVRAARRSGSAVGAAAAGRGRRRRLAGGGGAARSNGGAARWLAAVDAAASTPPRKELARARDDDDDDEAGGRRRRRRRAATSNATTISTTTTRTTTSRWRRRRALASRRRARRCAASRCRRRSARRSCARR